MDPFGNAIRFVFFSIVYVGANLALAEVARRRLDNFWFWLILFNVVPVISHALFIYLLFYERHRKESMKVISDISAKPEFFAPQPPKGRRRTSSSQMSVTPFDPYGRPVKKGPERRDRKYR